MRKKRLLAVLCLFTLAIVSLAWGRNGKPRPTQEQATQKQAPEVPDQVVYLHLFRQMAAFKKKAKELERDGKDSSDLKTYLKRNAELDDTEAQILDEIAAQCNVELQRQDAKAKAVIDAFKAQYPGGRVPHGEHPKPPTAELRAMSEERDAIVLRYRDFLRASLGEEGFGRFHKYVKSRLAPNAYPPQDAGLPHASR